MSAVQIVVLVVAVIAAGSLVLSLGGRASSALGLLARALSAGAYAAGPSATASTATATRRTTRRRAAITPIRRDAKPPNEGGLL